MKANRPFFGSPNWSHSARRSKGLTGWRKTIGTRLRKIGPTWPSVSIRRIIQAACLLVYFDLFFHVSWPYAPIFSSRVLPDKEWLPVETFLWIDPLTGLSTAIAAGGWNVALLGMAGILAAGLVIPRAFCGYLCPLGTLIDLLDFLVWKRLPRLRAQQGWPWVHLRFYLLAAVLAASLGGVLLAGLVAAIPVLTRGLLFSAGHLQLGFAKNWGMVPPLTGAMGLSLALFVLVFLLSWFRPRCWCRYVCPSGALLSLPSLLRWSKRQVDDRCIQCGKCIKICPFDAIQPDFATRALNCTFCQTCGGVCPTEAIQFIPLSPSTARPNGDGAAAQPLTRRAVLGAVAGGAAAALLGQWAPSSRARPVRPPGSVPEKEFLDLCIRCEQCIKVCPGPVLQAAGWEHGFEALWTPVAVFPHAGCHPDCNFCAQVCPTGAIRPLSLADKKRFLMGLADIDRSGCLPHCGERDCQLCFDECNAAGYRAIEMRPIQLSTGPIPEGMFSPEEIEQMGRILAPFVHTEVCVGCGLCEYRCQSAWVSQQKLLKRSAVIVKSR